jgi:glutamyl-tRNA reductase
MQLLAVGLNHHTAPLALREKVAFPADRIGDAVASARNWFSGSVPGGGEAAILSTCNRTELYSANRLQAGAENSIDATAHFLADYHKLPYAELRRSWAR